jgi:hypothetical protein
MTGPCRRGTIAPNWERRDRGSNARRGARTLNAEREDCNDRRRAKWRGGNNCLSQLGAGNGNRELALRLELADGAGVGIMDVFLRRFSMNASRGLSSRACVRVDGEKLMLVLAPQQMVQALPE